jgi:hypothetical protein
MQPMLIDAMVLPLGKNTVPDERCTTGAAQAVLDDIALNAQVERLSSRVGSLTCRGTTKANKPPRRRESEQLHRRPA